MKILLADSFPETHRLQLVEDGHDVTFDSSLDSDSLADAIADNEILIVRSTPVTTATLDAANSLKLIIRAGAGTNTIDKPHASEKGVRVCNVPGANADAVAELTMGLIIAVDRNIADNVQDLRNQIWNKKKYSKAQGLMGQNIGILGLGSIGMGVAARARAFAMNVFVIDKPGRSEAFNTSLDNAGIQRLGSMGELLQTCDIVSLHMPANDDTKGIINSDFLGKMKPNSVLVNTSRGELVDEAALINAMNEKGIRAGLDVYNNEPGAEENTFDCALASHPNVVGTHHIGASTEQAQTAVSDGVLKVIKSYQDGNLIFCVN